MKIEETGNMSAKPLHLLRIIKSRIVFNDEYNKARERNKRLEWPEYIRMCNYETKDDKFLMTPSFILNIGSDDFVIIVHDLKDIEADYYRPEIISFDSQRPDQFQIFSLDKKENGYELRLNYNMWDIGLPRRDNIILGRLEKDYPFMVRLNGRLHSRGASTPGYRYIENTYYIDYLGHGYYPEVVNDALCNEVRIQSSIPKTMMIKDLLK